MSANENLSVLSFDTGDNPHSSDPLNGQGRFCKKCIERYDRIKWVEWFELHRRGVLPTTLGHYTIRLFLGVWRIDGFPRLETMTGYHPIQIGWRTMQMALDQPYAQGVYWESE